VLLYFCDFCAEIHRNKVISNADRRGEQNAANGGDPGSVRGDSGGQRGGFDYA
jgi:hypothetical protein